MAERDERGQFKKGESGNPKGRAPKKREERYYEILTTTVTFEDWARIVRKAAEQAKRGDQAARTWLGNYLIGKPDENINLNSVEIVIRHAKQGL